MKILTAAFLLVLAILDASAHRSAKDWIRPEWLDNLAFGEAHDYLTLFHHCEPIKLTVHELSETADRIGLRREAVLATAERVLRESRLLGSYKHHANLAIHVLINRDSFAIFMEYSKPVRHTTIETRLWATTWSDGWLYSHNGQLDSILHHVRNNVTTFIVAYTHANAESCEAKR